MQQKTHYRIVTLGLKGGTGKSTTAWHLAHIFGPLHPTIIVDADNLRSCLNWQAIAEALDHPIPFQVVSETGYEDYIAEHGVPTYRILDTQASIPAQKLGEILRRPRQFYVLPLRPDVSNVAAVAALARDIRELTPEQPPHYAALITHRLAQAQVSNAEDTQAALRRAGIPVFEAMIRQTKKFSDASDAGLHVGKYGDKAAQSAWKEYQAVAAQIMEDMKS